MIGVMIVPTGLGAEIGGHAGDGNTAAKLVASCCDKLITHPNVVNAADVNEMTENTLYVEGSILDRFLEGTIRLKEVRQNKILLVANKPLRMDTVNSVSTARVTVGIDVDILELETPFTMVASYDEKGIATGLVTGYEELVEQVGSYEFDALALHTPIELKEEVAIAYYKHGGVNPWGGVEAKASRLVADRLNKPVAHAPIETDMDKKELFELVYNTAVDPRIAPETISLCYLQCVLKGLNKAPQVSHLYGLSFKDVDFMISPDGCWGRPHEACKKHSIPIIFVKENSTVENKVINYRKSIFVENYWEAVGVIMSMRIGIDKMSVRRPLSETSILK